MAVNSVPAESLGARPAFVSPERDMHSSGVSWGAVIGGACVTAAFALILLALGAGLELSAISPWSNVGISAVSAGIGAAVWLMVVQIVASGLGGYLTGRLRSRWVLVHTDEVYFRDTSNGFLAWAVALVITVVLLASAATSMVGGAAEREAYADRGGTVVRGVGPLGYFVDRLFRSDHPGSETKDAATEAEADRILANALRRKDTPATDQNYLAGLVAAKTGIGLPAAQTRVSDVISEARQVEDTARKATARFLLWFFLSLLMGAFSASYAATIGGRQRDHVKAV